MSEFKFVDNGKTIYILSCSSCGNRHTNSTANNECYFCDIKRKKEENPTYQISQLIIEIRQIKEILAQLVVKLDK